MKYLIYILLALGLTGCGIYNFTGGSTRGAKTFQVNFFRNDAPLVEPGLDQGFTLALQDLTSNQTNLSLIDHNGDLVYEGEVVEFSITPMTVTAGQTVVQNRVTIGVNARSTNHTEEKKDFEKRFSFYYDYPVVAQLNSVRGQATPQIFECITQGILNASLAD